MAASAAIFFSGVQALAMRAEEGTPLRAPELGPVRKPLAVARAVGPGVHLVMLA
jgi:hypothetical protein